MMNNAIGPSRTLLFMIIFSGYCCAAQEIEYFTKSGKKTTKELSYVYKVLTYDDVSRDTIMSYLFTKNNTIQSQYVLGDSSDENHVINFENGKMKEVRQYKADVNSYRQLTFYPNGNYQRMDIIPGNWRKLLFNSLILAYWDSTGTQLVTDGNGHCRCYYVTADSATQKYHEDGQLVEGYREGEWLTYRNDTLEYREMFSKGVFKYGIRYDGDVQTPYDKAQMPPEFPGGREKMTAFVDNHLYYPLDARRDGVEGTVVVSCMVNRDGSITDIKVTKGLSKTIDHQAVEIVRKMPAWKPAMLRGKKVSSPFVLKIRFSLAAAVKSGR